MVSSQAFDAGFGLVEDDPMDAWISSGIKRASVGAFGVVLGHLSV